MPFRLACLLKLARAEDVAVVAPVVEVVRRRLVLRQCQVRLRQQVVRPRQRRPKVVEVHRAVRPLEQEEPLLWT